MYIRGAEMTGFWEGITGQATEAFSKEPVDVLPNGTLATAKIVKASNETGNFGDSVQIEWLLTGGEFTGRKIFQKLYIYDGKPERQAKARNMLKYILQLFHVRCSTDGPPTNVDLMQLTACQAGLKIMEWQMERNDGSVGHGNSVAEIHPIAGFECVTGKYREFKTKSKADNKTNIAFEFGKELNDDIPF